MLGVLGSACRPRRARYLRFLSICLSKLYRSASVDLLFLIEDRAREEIKDGWVRWETDISGRGETCMQVSHAVLDGKTCLRSKPSFVFTRRKGDGL